ncbi:alpha carbonic anhydrase [Glomus cerebriforme]|uniref:carbonic anhydrase n=1 Tax=Glomus cerebriforme TaxID=658196 RepID=A0A397SFW9_9GLOM|nr:alpha carbonic anhydrase [Glomus cerebriforme]
MKSFLILTIVLSLILVSSNFAAEHGAYFDYEGYTGPGYWSQLDVKYRMCGVGQKQSPINFHTNIDYASVSPYVYMQNVNYVRMENNGHTIELSSPQWQNSFINFDSTNYYFKQVHFHTPSEHRINGIHMDLEAHFVFEDPNTKRKAVVGVLYYIDPLGTNSNFIDPIITWAPRTKGNATYNVFVDIASVFSLVREAGPNWAYRYSGSLTTPPCHESVTWWVATKQLPISATQLVFNLRVYMGFNSRPTQSRNGRTVPGY